MDEAKIQEINKVIAEAMGWTGFTKKRTEHDVILAHPPGEKTAWSSNWPNPYTSKDDVFEAVDVICGKSWEIHFYKQDNGYKVLLYVHGWFEGKAETPEAAVTLILIKFLKEDK